MEKGSSLLSLHSKDEGTSGDGLRASATEKIESFPTGRESAHTGGFAGHRLFLPDSVGCYEGLCFHLRAGLCCADPAFTF